MPKRDFKDKVVIITGAAGGLGRALCRCFGEAGALVVGIDRAAQELECLARAFQATPVRFTGHAGDVTDWEVTQKLVQKILQDFGRIDVLINNAGLSHRSRFAHTNIEVIRRVLAVNFFGALNWTAAALPALQQSRGMIITLSSVAGFSPLLGRTGYAASKHALHGFFESLRPELEAEGVAIMLVCPSFIDTAINKNALGADGNPVRHEQVVVGRKMAPLAAAQRILQGARREKQLLLVGNISRLAYWLNRLAPRFYARGMARRLRAEIE
ncbi:MAG: SDR family oxidoreductase [candidate division KSB1 bacterium]|nr:SDR family oxidoreductase [candidate division KSB1 bacterium]MDZ7273587.1 SDR family oxidoreductase [candidate division KSB1 bacterium]MDZ7286822.1 SDR family oxidoreductase [candidate division KSB1 bacterium]MDZ7299821.1 SDR family oxidoreductase [candidate division KSB1 bacterium]MDZ7308454.1 SDR family oxidoreductase [candidate division KSB1 bacterium]